MIENIGDRANNVTKYCHVILYLQGKQKQSKRTQTFFQFCNAKEGILICTDVAARGLDIPAVDWIVQFDPPDDPKVCSLSFEHFVIKPSLEE